MLVCRIKIRLRAVLCLPLNYFIDFVHVQCHPYRDGYTLVDIQLAYALQCQSRYVSRVITAFQRFVKRVRDDRSITAVAVLFAVRVAGVRKLIRTVLPLSETIIRHTSEEIIVVQENAL